MSMRPEKAGLIGGTAGVVLGGTSWLIVLGIVLKSPLLTLIPVLWGVICVLAVFSLFRVRPQRYFAIVGMAILWLILLNFVLGNLLYERIPDMIGGTSTGKDQFSLLHLNIMLALMSLFGFACLVIDIFKRGDS